MNWGKLYDSAKYTAFWTAKSPADGWRAGAERGTLLGVALAALGVPWILARFARGPVVMGAHYYGVDLGDKKWTRD